MVKVNVIAVGKVKEKYFADGISEYAKRLSRYCEFNIIEIAEENYKKVDDGLIDIIKEKEGERILKATKGYLIVMDMNGEKMSSKRFAKLLGELPLTEGRIDFVIGGSYGVSDSVKKKANKLFSFSDMTFPHTLFRLMLTEQIYRAFSINEGSAYHK